MILCVIFFLGHTYRYHHGGPIYKVDQRVEAFNFSDYSRIWLGGDISSEAFLNRATLVYLDNIFDLDAPKTQYAIGNHDIRNGNIQYYHEFTGKKSYNVYSNNGVVSVCINSQLNPSNCEDLNQQFNLIKNVCDTIQESSHLVFIMHNCLFANVPGLPPVYTYAHSDFSKWNANCESSTQTFLTAIYPLLQNVKAKGIPVYCIMGDSGSGSKQFHAEVEDSIHFFSNGIGNSKYTDPTELAQQPKDRLLVFEHNTTTHEMNWFFQDLDSLLNTQ